MFINNVEASENMWGRPHRIFCSSSEFLIFPPKVTLGLRNTITVSEKCHGFLSVFVLPDRGPEATLLR